MRGVDYSRCMRVPRHVLVATIIPLATLVLYFCGAAMTPPGKSFTWMHALNTGDPHAYLSWVAQARDEFNLGMGGVDLLAAAHFQAQPPGAGVELQLRGALRWVPGLQQMIAIATHESLVAGPHQCLRLRGCGVLRCHSARWMMIFCTSEVPS